MPAPSIQHPLAPLGNDEPDPFVPTLATAVATSSEPFSSLEASVKDNNAEEHGPVASTSQGVLPEVVLPRPPSASSSSSPASSRKRARKAAPRTRPLELPTPWPHQSPALLQSLEPGSLLAVIQLLSVAQEAATKELHAKERELKALAELLGKHGVSASEQERTRVRARADEPDPSFTRWRCEVPEEEEELPDDDEGAAHDQDKLDLEDLADALSDEAFSPSPVMSASLPLQPVRSATPSLLGTSPPAASSIGVPVAAQTLPMARERSRARHPSLSSRMFSLFNASPPPELASSDQQQHLDVSSTTASTRGNNTRSSSPAGRPLSVASYNKKRSGSVLSTSSSLSAVSTSAEASSTYSAVTPTGTVSSAGGVVRKHASKDSLSYWKSWGLPLGGGTIKKPGAKEIESDSVAEEEGERQTLADEDGETTTPEQQMEEEEEATPRPSVIRPAAAAVTEVASETDVAFTKPLPDPSSSEAVTVADTSAPLASSTSADLAALLGGPPVAALEPALSTPDLSSSEISPFPGASTSGEQKTQGGTKEALEGLMSSSQALLSRERSKSPVATRGTPDISPDGVRKTRKGAHRRTPSHFEAVALAAELAPHPASAPPSPLPQLETPETAATEEDVPGGVLVNSQRAGKTIRKLVMELLGGGTNTPPSPNLSPNPDSRGRRRSSRDTQAPESPSPVAAVREEGLSAKSAISSRSTSHTSLLTASGALSPASQTSPTMSRTSSRQSPSELSQQQPATSAGTPVPPSLARLGSFANKYSLFSPPGISMPLPSVSLSSQPAAATAAAMTASTSSGSIVGAGTASTTTTSITMELGTISAPESKPPAAVGIKNDALVQSPLGEADEAANGPLVDRFGFVYDVRTSMKLLRETRKRKNMADSDVLDAAAAKREREAEEASVSDVSLAQAAKEEEAEIEALREALGLPPSAASPKPGLSGTKSPSVASGTSGTSEPTRGKLVRTDSTDAASGQQSMRRLLAQLTDSYNAADRTRVEAWDAFIRRRQRHLAKSAAADSKLKDKDKDSKPPLAGLWAEPVDGVEDAQWSENLIGVAQMGVSGKSGKEDWKDFKELVAKGISIAHRPKIWAECSGATEIREPGVYQELLATHRAEENPCLTQIDMDCHRTFPTNVYFAGNGQGVAKLRNVLVAYSWRNPEIGYCQGMNNLTATLLLTYPSEEDAFWVLCCIVEKILPSDYYTSQLLVSQADQMVLKELVARHLPKVAMHFEDLGVELPAISFGWFLSLFTDSLPIQTLFRIWDCLFVFGTVVLFRVAIAIIQINQAEILATDSAAGLYALIKMSSTHLYQVDKLFKVALDELRPVVRDRDIATMRSKYVAVLEAQLSPDPPS